MLNSFTRALFYTQVFLWFSADMAFSYPINLERSTPTESSQQNPPIWVKEELAAHTIYASTIPGVKLDCDIVTGHKIGGGRPTDNAAKFNAVLATATSTNPVHLVIDGGSALGAALVIPNTGNVTISGLGWSTGFFVLSGSNCCGIQSAIVGTTNQANSDAVHPPAPRTILEKNVILRDFYFNHNKGTYPNGLVRKGPADGTLAGMGQPDARGWPNKFFYTTIMLVGLTDVKIQNVSIYDSPSYSINPNKCQRVWIDGCSIIAADMIHSDNVAGIQFEGGCSDVMISRCHIAVNDDAIAINLYEDYAENGSDFIVTDCIIHGFTIGRIFGLETSPSASAHSRRIIFQNITGTVKWWGIIVGNGNVFNDTGVETNHSILLDGFDVEITGVDFTTEPLPAMVVVAANVGLIELSKVKIVNPKVAHPLIRMSKFNNRVSAMRIIDCGIHRSASGNAAASAIDASHTGSTIGDLAIHDFHVTEQIGKSYADIPTICNFDGTTIGKLSIDASVEGAKHIVNATARSPIAAIEVKDLSHVSNDGGAISIVCIKNDVLMVPVSLGRYTSKNVSALISGNISISGPGVLPSGLPLHDANLADNTPYLSLEKDSAPCIKIAGVTKVLSFVKDQPMKQPKRPR